ncbi:MAG TPA: MBL fold metallo-hydrolase, partial [Thermomicrobiales bacterium]|nr:MBL fold metallo-hydrolase [Thermomicrobiales bacterium]
FGLVCGAHRCERLALYTLHPAADGNRGCGVASSATGNTGGELTQDWFRVTAFAPGVICIEEPLHEERVKSYLIVGDERAVLLDTGMGVGDLKALVRSLTDRPLTVVQSHAHFDHIGGAHQFAGDCEILIHPEQADDLRRGVAPARIRRGFAPEHLSGPLPAGRTVESMTIPGVEPTGFLTGGETLDLGGRTLETIDAPGHCRGLLALLDRDAGALWSTDAVYAGPLYAQMDDSNLVAYQETMDALAALAPALRAVYPAHGPTPIEPALLRPMRDAIADVAAGRRPDSTEGGVGRHEFDGFAVLVRDEAR